MASTKSDTPLRKIDTEYAKGELRRPKWADQKPVCALDTETRDGSVFQLAIAHEGNGWRGVIDAESGNVGDEITPSRLFYWLTRPALEDSINVWFNLGFDANVILSVLPADKLEILHIQNTVEWEDYQITYLPGKLLRIKKGKHETEKGNTAWKATVSHYDVAQIFRDNLEGAAQEWLGYGKLDDVDASRFGDRDYLEANYAEITEYAKRDAEITMELGRELIDQSEEIGIPAAQPISTGFLAEQYLRNRLDSKPGWGLTKMQDMAWESYAGGRFEVFERGDVGSVAGPDINSAYPAVLADLPDPGTMRWGIFADAEATFQRVADADYSLVTATVTTDPERRIQPFAVKSDEGKVKYPALDEYRLTVVGDIFEFAVSEGIVTDFEIHEVATGYCTDSTEYPFDFIPDLYQQRKEWESDGREKAATMLKIILNSMYGKLTQTTIQSAVLEGEINPAEVGGDFTQALGHAVEQNQRGGAMFNPFLASHITGLTRLELHRAVVDTGLENDTILFATDSIMVDEAAYVESDFDSLLGDRLGEWDYDYRGQAFVIGSGVYEIDRTDKPNQTKTVTRGFKEADLGDGENQKTLREAAADAGDADVEITQERPRTIGEALFRNESITLDDVGVFEESTRGLVADFDDKRDWSVDAASFSDLLEGRERSSAEVLSGADR